MINAKGIILTLPAAVFALAVGSDAHAMGDGPAQEDKVIQELPVPQNVNGPDLRKVHPESDPINPLHNPFEKIGGSDNGFGSLGGLGGGVQQDTIRAVEELYFDVSGEENR